MGGDTALAVKIGLHDFERAGKHHEKGHHGSAQFENDLSFFDAPDMPVGAQPVDLRLCEDGKGLRLGIKGARWNGHGRRPPGAARH